MEYNTTGQKIKCLLILNKKNHDNLQAIAHKYNYSKNLTINKILSFYFEKTKNKDIIL